MKVILKTLLALYFAGSTGLAFPQQGIVSAGAEATGASGTVSWSAAQVVYCQWSDVTGFLTEGVQQPYELFNPIGINELQQDPGLKLYPNPTSGNVTLKVTDPDLIKLDVYIYDMQGTRLREVSADKEEIGIPMEDLASGTYFLNIFQNNKPYWSFKIIKK
jgi:hypothetical protein